MAIADTAHRDTENLLHVEGEARLYRALRRFWHPAAYASELGSDPMRVVLLDEPLVLVRLAGKVRCFPDLCAHRGTALSLGSVEDDQLRCAYHGWIYGAEGVCTSIPARFGASIPRRARLHPFLVEERDGVIWVCLVEDPQFPIPEFPQFHDPAFRVIEVPAYGWRCSAHRRIENYVDFLHFNDTVIGQDRPIVESQRPEELPFDLSAELHIKGVDRVSIEYPKWLVELAQEVPA